MADMNQNQEFNQNPIDDTPTYTVKKKETLEISPEFQENSAEDLANLFDGFEDTGTYSVLGDLAQGTQALKDMFSGFSKKGRKSHQREEVAFQSPPSPNSRLAQSSPQFSQSNVINSQSQNTPQQQSGWVSMPQQQDSRVEASSEHSRDTVNLIELSSNKEQMSDSPSHNTQKPVVDASQKPKKAASTSFIAGLTLETLETPEESRPMTKPSAYAGYKAMDLEAAEAAKEKPAAPSYKLDEHIKTSADAEARKKEELPEYEKGKTPVFSQPLVDIPLDELAWGEDDILATNDNRAAQTARRNRTRQKKQIQPVIIKQEVKADNSEIMEYVKALEGGISEIQGNVDRMNREQQEKNAANEQSWAKNEEKLLGEMSAMLDKRLAAQETSSLSDSQPSEQMISELIDKRLAQMDLPSTKTKTQSDYLSDDSEKTVDSNSRETSNTGLSVSAADLLSDMREPIDRLAEWQVSPDEHDLDLIRGMKSAKADRKDGRSVYSDSAKGFVMLEEVEMDAYDYATAENRYNQAQEELKRYGSTNVYTTQEPVKEDFTLRARVEASKLRKQAAALEEQQRQENIAKADEVFLVGADIPEKHSYAEGVLNEVRGDETKKPKKHMASDTKKKIIAALVIAVLIFGAYIVFGKNIAKDNGSFKEVEQTQQAQSALGLDYA